MTATPTTPSTEFERTHCGRCGGSGSYSYCQMHGSTCFGCAGTGKKLTKRGAAAYAWFKEQRTVRADQVVAGNRIHSGGAKFTVTEISEPHVGAYVGAERQPVMYVTFANADGKFRYSTMLDSKVEVLPRTEADRVAALRAAFAYQDTLGKMGQPLKNKAKVSAD
ncbi:MAG: hypothetical protein EHM78_01885 [Myxococcaceae bacterium]|nr:MAG: hypothetical protein EHM78_01885 [Myxococcaceae bacterium]